MNEAQVKRVGLHALAMTMGVVTYWLVLAPAFHIGGH
jgi:hypothetical protein